MPFVGEFEVPELPGEAQAIAAMRFLDTKIPTIKGRALPPTALLRLRRLRCVDALYAAAAAVRTHADPLTVLFSPSRPHAPRNAPQGPSSSRLRAT